MDLFLANELSFRRRSPFTKALAILAVALTYAVASKFAFLLATLPGHMSPFFPSAGVALGAVLILGRPALLGIWLGSLTANSLFQQNGSVLVNSIIALGAVLAAEAGCRLVRRLCGDAYPLHNTKTLLILVVLGAGSAAAVSATIGLLTLALSGSIPWKIHSVAWLTWFLGDATGIIVATPLILAWQPYSFSRKPPRFLFEAMLLGVVTITASHVVFFRGVPFEYGLMPILAWAGYRFGLRAATATGGVIALLSAIGTSIGHGPFHRETINNSLLALQSFLALTAIFNLLFAVAMEQLKRNEALLRSFFDGSPIGMFRTTLDGRFLYCNEALATMFGYASPEELIEGVNPQGTGVTLWGDVREREAFIATVRAANGNYCHREVHLHQPNGRTVHGAFSMKIISDNNWHEPYTTGFLQDFTEHRLAEETIRKFFTALDQSPASIVITDIHGAIEYVNPSFTRTSGYTQEEVRGQNPRILKSDHLPAEAYQSLWKTITAGKAWEGEFHNKKKNGAFYWEHAIISPIMETGGAITGFVAVKDDITERKRIEESNRVLVSNVPGAVYRCDVAAPWHMAFCSQGFLELTGRPPSAYLEGGLAYREIIHPDDFEMVDREVAAGVAEGRPYELSYRIILPDGGQRWVFERGQANRGADGRPEWLDGVILNITAQKMADEELQKSRANLSALIESTDELVWSVDRKFNLLTFNRALARYLRQSYGKEAFIGAPPEVVLPPDSATYWRSQYENALAKGRVRQEFSMEDGRVLELTLNSIFQDRTPVGVSVFGKDLTERRRTDEEKAKLQAQLQQSQKMESLGTLASGVAHDMNNVLGAVLGLASAHIGTQPYGSPLHQALETICKAAERGGKMVKSLLAIARQHPADEAKLDLNTILREQISLLEHTTLAKICLKMHLEAGLRPILGDASALTHAFLNLCVNALDTMPENGTLTLHTRTIDNHWIEVEVEDNGRGMPKEVLVRATDPFFTTKDTGKGTGLGLSMVFSTVEAHGGSMAIDSEVGKGTRVRLRFRPFEEMQTQALEPSVAETTLITGRELKVLLVDDDDLLQCSVLAMLNFLGHMEVTTALRGEDALAILEAGLEPDLVILDMNMPGLGGGGTLPRLRTLRPKVPVLLATGRADQAAQALASAHPGVTLLSKPFGMRELHNHLEALRPG